MNIKFPEGKDKLLVFEITMKPDEGMYKCANQLLLIGSCETVLEWAAECVLPNV